jgi:hypothetical protein
MKGSEPPLDRNDSNPLSPDEAFALLGNDTRVGILQALWDAFESGKGDNAVPYSELFEQVDIRDSGNFSYHLEKLTGPFVRSTGDGYELKQTGINVVRAVVTGTIIDDQEFGPTQVDVACPICDAPIEIAYADELMTATCTACDGALRWNGESGYLYLGLVPPAVIEGRPVEAAFRAAITYSFHEFAAFHDDVCPHCSSSVEVTVTVCSDHDPGTGTLCSTCDRAHAAEAWLVCSRCKRSMFPPVAVISLDNPDVTAFYHAHGVEHRFATWETAVRSFDVREELLSEDPLEMRFTIPAGNDELRLTLDDELNVIDASQ